MEMKVLGEEADSVIDALPMTRDALLLVARDSVYIRHLLVLPLLKIQYRRWIVYR